MAMDRQLLKEIVVEQEGYFLSREAGVRRTILDQVSRYMRVPHAVVVSGIRRCGKSTLLSQIGRAFYPKGTHYFSFEDERLMDFGPDDFGSLHEIMVALHGDRRVWMLDEIQNAPKWEQFVRRMTDAGHKFYLTGSNASLLSMDLGTKLTGRNVQVALQPFSFREFMDFKGRRSEKDPLAGVAERASTKRLFDEYLKSGGMPEYLTYGDRDLLKQVYDDIIYRDIAVRHEIREVKALRELALHCLTNMTGLFTYNSVRKLLGLGSVNTAKSYIEFLEDSHIISTTGRMAWSLKKTYMSPRKVYCVDNGLADAVAYRFSKDKGKFLENLVFNALKGSYEHMFYFSTESDTEVDFAVRDGKGRVRLMQVAYSFADKEVKEREVGSLAMAMKELKIGAGLILTDDAEEEMVVEGRKISVMPVYKWLVKEDDKSEL